MSAGHNTYSVLDSTTPAAPAPTGAMDVDTNQAPPLQAPLPPPPAETPRPAAEMQPTVSEEMEGVEEMPFNLVPVKTSALGREQLQAVLEYQSELYPPEMNADTAAGPNLRISTADLFELRGNDIPLTIPARVRDRAKFECVLGFRGVDERGEILRPAVFVGVSLQSTKATTSQLQPEPKGKGKKGKQTASKGPAPAPKDCVKVSFHTDSQTPNIQITTRKLGQESGKSDLLSTRIWAQDIDVGASNMAAIIERPVLPQQPTFGLEANQQLPGNAPFAELNAMAQEGKLYEVTIRLKDGRKPRVWTGLRADEVDAIRRRDPKDSVKDKTVTRDATVQYLDECQVLSFYIRASQAGDIAEWNKLIGHFTTVTSLAQQYGNFWFYRNFLRNERWGEVDLTSTLIGDLRFPIPRWLVTVWMMKHFAATATTPERWEVDTPYSWASLRVFDQYPEPKDTAFLLKLGIMAESDRQVRNLMELVQSSNECGFRAQFDAMEESGNFVLQVWMVDPNHQMSQLKMPAVDTRITIELDPVAPDTPAEHRVVKYTGVVCEDLFHNGANFCCVVRGSTLPFYPKKGKALDITATYPVQIAYLTDELPMQRQLLATEMLLAIASSEKPTGVDMKAQFLGDDTPAPQTNYLMSSLSAEKLAAYKKYLEMRRPRLNAAQMSSAMDIVQSSSGVTGIQGPPGTGKTNLLECIGNGLMRIGRKSMFCAPQNEAVLNLYETFDTQVKKELERAANSRAGLDGYTGLKDHEYVHFTGAYHTIKGAKELQKQLKEGELQTAEEGLDTDEADLTMGCSNALMEYARNELTRRHAVPQHVWTFGYKLRQMIETWAGEEDSEMHPQRAASKQFVAASQTKVKGAAERKAHQSGLDELELKLGGYYLANVVKVVFCTLSTSVHPVLTSSYSMEHLLIDESAHESLGGLVVPCGAYYKHIKHVTLAGDHKQGKGVLLSKDNNVGMGALSRCLFQEIAEDPRKQHATFMLTEGYRCAGELYEFTSKFYGGKLTASGSTRDIDRELQNTVDAFWTHYLRGTFGGSKRQVAIDVSSANTSHSNLAGTTTKFNENEAIVLCRIIWQMVRFIPPMDTDTKKYRPITFEDIMVVCPYTGQVLEVRSQFRVLVDGQLGEDIQLATDGIVLATTNHSQGKQKPIVFFSIVVNPGAEQVKQDVKVPLDFVLDDHNINVSMSRQRISRHIVGGLRYLTQMAYDKHPQANLAESDAVIGTDEIWNALAVGERPDTSNLDAGGRLQFLRSLDRGQKAPRSMFNFAAGPQLPAPQDSAFGQLNTKPGSTFDGTYRAAKKQKTDEGDAWTMEDVEGGGTGETDVARRGGGANQNSSGRGRGGQDRGRGGQRGRGQNRGGQGGGNRGGSHNPNPLRRGRKNRRGGDGEDAGPSNVGTGGENGEG